MSGSGHCFMEMDQCPRQLLRVCGRAVLLLGWLVFLASFFLPATNILQAAGTPVGTPLTGWQAFRSSIDAGAFNIWAWIGDIRVGLFLIFPVTNAIMLVIPIFGWLRHAALLPALILVPSAIVPWRLPHELTGDLFVGFYLWNGSYLLASVGGVVSALSHLDDDEE